MRVLMICPQLPTEGAPGSMAPTQRQIQSLAQLGIDVEIVDMRGIPVLKYAAALHKVRRMARSFDLIHAHYGNCGWLARAQWRTPIVLSFMGTDVHTARWSVQPADLVETVIAVFNRLILARIVSPVIVKSQEMAQAVSPANAHVISNGVDTTLFRPMDQAAARHRLKLDPHKRYVLFPGNPANPRKGYPLARQALELANAATNDAAEMLTLWDVRPDEVPLWMNACDVVLLASHAEGSPNVVKEAMACNRPIVAAEIGDVADLLHGVAGCVACPRNATSLGQALSNTLQRRPASNGRDHVFARGLDLESVAWRIVDVYEQAFRARRCALPPGFPIRRSQTRSASPQNATGADSAGEIQRRKAIPQPNTSETIGDDVDSPLCFPAALRRD